MSKFAGLGLAVDKPFTVALSHPVTGARLRTADGDVEASVSILSLDSAVAQQHQRDVLDARLGMRGRPSAAQVEAETVDLLSKLTQGWTLVDLDGNRLEIELTPANARELYAAGECRWIREQVEQAINDRKNVKRA